MKIIKTKEVKSGLDANIFQEPEPTLWYCQGMFCIIPMQIIQNAIEESEMYQKFSSDTKHPVVIITWDQGIPVDPKVGYALMGAG